MKINNIFFLFIAFVLLALYKQINHLFIIKVIFLVMLFFSILIFWYSNKNYWGLILLNFGIILNNLVILLNNNRMPVSRKAIVKCSISNLDYINLFGEKGSKILIDEFTKFSFLGDIVYIPGFLGNSSRIVSTGDILIILGSVITFANLLIHLLSIRKT